MRFEKFFSPCDERIKGYLGGMKLVSLGNRSSRKVMRGWFVPYEIKLTMTLIRGA